MNNGPEHNTFADGLCVHKQIPLPGAVKAQHITDTRRKVASFATWLYCGKPPKLPANMQQT